MISRDALRMACLLAVMFAGSCTSEPETHSGVLQDGAQNHPITVEPGYRTLKLADRGPLTAEENASLSAFAEDFMARGTGSISITVPPGPGAERTIAALGEQLVGLGVPRSRILVGVQDQSDGLIAIGYISYEAHSDTCGDWSTNVADTFDNTPMPNFGCAVQRNIAAQIADPRDLAQPRGLGPSDVTRRMQVLEKYEQGQTTATAKTKDQSGAVSDIAQ